MDKLNRFWSKQEMDLLKKAWVSGAYGKEDLTRIFDRSWPSLSNKAKNMSLPAWGAIEARVRVQAIEKALQEDHVI